MFRVVGTPRVRGIGYSSCTVGNAVDIQRIGGWVHMPAELLPQPVAVVSAKRPKHVTVRASFM